MKVKTFLVVHASRVNYVNTSGPYTGQKRVSKLSIKKMLAKRPPPSAIGTSDVVVELEVDVPEELFYDRTVQASVTVPVAPGDPVVATAEPVKINRGGRALNRG